MKILDEKVPFLIKLIRVAYTYKFHGMVHGKSPGSTLLSIGCASRRP
jgi:hypothetical protein